MVNSRRRHFLAACGAAATMGCFRLIAASPHQDAYLAPSEDAVSRRPAVLVELFTSEGCSSCPPADALLAALDRREPTSGVEAIVLSEHVDYWNHGGWSDPYSSPGYSERQLAYARRLRLDDVYTPQMVVDGASAFVGSDAHRARAAIEQSAQAQMRRSASHCSEIPVARYYEFRWR